MSELKGWTEPSALAQPSAFDEVIEKILKTAPAEPNAKTLIQALKIWFFEVSIASSSTGRLFVSNPDSSASPVVLLFFADPKNSNQTGLIYFGARSTDGFGVDSKVQIIDDSTIADETLDNSTYCYEYISSGTFGQPRGKRKRCLIFSDGAVVDTINRQSGNARLATRPYRVNNGVVSFNGTQYKLSKDRSTLTSTENVDQVFKRQEPIVFHRK